MERWSGYRMSDEDIVALADDPKMTSTRAATDPEHQIAIVSGPAPKHFTPPTPVVGKPGNSR